MSLTLLVLLFFIATLSVLSPPAAAQQPSDPSLDEDASGTHYIIAFPDTVSNKLDERFPNTRVNPELQIWIYSSVKNKVVVSGPSGRSVLTLEPGRFKIYDAKPLVFITEPNVVTRNTYSVEADQPIVIYCYLATIQGLEAWTPIPVDQWGTEHYAAMIPGEIVREIGIAGETEIPTVKELAPSEIVMIAAYDNTTITFTPPPGTDFLYGPPHNITLNAGEAYMVQSRVIADDNFDGEQEDLAGTVIRSDKPIGVTTGNTRAQAQQDETGLKDNAYKNMLMEWITPNDQHGTEFVFMPTWDNHRPGIGASVERKREYVRVYSTQGKQTKGFHHEQLGSGQVPFTVKIDAMREFAFGSPVAVVFKTERPAQAFMHSMAVVFLKGSSPCYRGLPCLDYTAIAPYMVELVPREQWTTFAPYYAPVNPGTMAHYINVVTDTGSVLKIRREDGTLFPFTRPIPGTDLVWGSMSVQQGLDHYIIARDGAKFTGFVYGIMEGAEAYRPGRTRKKDPNPSIASGGDHGSPMPLHPAEYEEYNALSYGYPLAPKRRVLRPSDSLQIDVQRECGRMLIKILTLNANPVGLRSITLDQNTVTNAKLTPVDPAKLSDIIFRTRVDVMVEPIDPTRSASATVIIKDRTGKIWRVEYSYTADRVEIDPQPALDFGMVTLNESAEKVVTITNPLDRPIEIGEIRLAFGTAITTFEIVGTNPSGPAENPVRNVTIPAGGKLTVTIRVTPKLENQLYVDTLKIALPCARFALPMMVATAKPCIYVGDLSFGTFVVGDRPKSLSLKVCNMGAGFVSFNGAILDWLDRNDFDVTPADIARLGGRKLGPNECETINVTFTPKEPGVYQTTGRFFANTRDCRDTSVWTAIVTKPGPALTGYDWHERWLVAKAGANCTKDDTARYEALVDVSNSGTAPVRVKSIDLVDPDALDGSFRLDASNRLTTILPGDEIRPGDKRQQRVLFFPTGERTYLAKVRLITEAGDTIYSILSGIGIESHGSVTGATYGPILFTPGATESKQVTLRALPTRPLRVDGIRIVGADAAEFQSDATGFPWVLQPNEQRTFNVTFRPQRPGERRATIEFLGDHSLCDDSTNTLVGTSFTRGVVTRGFEAGTILTCESRDSVVEITNSGSDTVTVNDVKLDDRSGYFSIKIDELPFLLAPGETRRFAVRFEPLKIGAYTASVLFDVIDHDGTPLVTPPATLGGGGRILTVPAHIGRNYRGLPGSVVTTPVELDQPLDEANITKLFIGVLYNNKMMRLANGSTDPADLTEMLKGTLLDGWTLQIVESDHPEGEYLAVLTAPPGKTLKGTGALLNPKFQLYLGSVDSAKLSFYMLLVGKQCARVVPSPGLARIDSVCGLNLRLIESTGFGYALDQNKPNPFNPSTDITFSLGLDGPTRLTVHDELGRQVAVLVDGYMKPGTYQVTWDASAQPSGLYYYRLESGVWTRTTSMILRK